MPDEHTLNANNDPAPAVITPVALDGAPVAPAAVPDSTRPQELPASDYGRSKSNFQQDDGRLSFFESVQYEIEKAANAVADATLYARIMIIIFSTVEAIKKQLQGTQMEQAPWLQKFLAFVTPLSTGIAMILALFHLLPGVTADSIGQTLTQLASAGALVQTAILSVLHLVNAHNVAATPGSPTNTSTPSN